MKRRQRVRPSRPHRICRTSKKTLLFASLSDIERKNGHSVVRASAAPAFR